MQTIAGQSRFALTHFPLRPSPLWPSYALGCAGNRFGVAKNVTLHAVRVLDCAGRSQVSTMLKVCEPLGVSPAAGSL